MPLIIKVHLFFRNSLNHFMKQPKPILTRSKHMQTSTEYRIEGEKNPILQVKEELSNFCLAVWVENWLNLELCVLSVYAQSCLNTFLKNTNTLSVLYWLSIINVTHFFLTLLTRNNWSNSVGKVQMNQPTRCSN